MANPFPPTLPAEPAPRPVVAKASGGRLMGCLTVVLVIGLLVSVLFNFMFLADGLVSVTGTAQSLEPVSEIMLKQPVGETEKKVVHLDLDGMISSIGNGYGGLPQLTRQIRAAAADDNVVAIVLRINSPGGEVTASDNLYHEVSKANYVKPVIIFMDSLAASGGYYIACGGRKIVASHTSLTGSIGVIMQGLNYRELFEKVGLEATTFKSGAFKDMLSGSREMREEEKEYIQSLVMEMYDRFVGIVAESRGLDVDFLKTGVADGRIISGAGALEAKLVDALGYLEDAYEVALAEAGVTDAAIVTYRQPFQLGNLIGLLGGKAGTIGKQKIEIDISDRLVPRLQPGVLYYLMPPLEAAPEG
jgi:protease-4